MSTGGKFVILDSTDCFFVMRDTKLFLNFQKGIENTIKITCQMNNKRIKLQAFGRLLDLLDQLRIQCPWDRKQTNESLRTHTIEETYELSEALIRDNVLEIKKELGDVLLQIIFYSKIAEEKKQFDIADVCQSLCEKLIFRHPHVFGNENADHADQVSRNWEQLKLQEGETKHTVFEGLPKSLPSLVKACRIQEKARNSGFDWEQKEDVLEKVREKFMELQNEIIQMDKDKMENEFGDLFFSLINVAHLYQINPDNALEKTNQKFMKRFRYIERKTTEQGKQLKDLTLSEMEMWWQMAKSLDR